MEERVQAHSCQNKLKRLRDSASHTLTSSKKALATSAQRLQTAKIASTRTECQLRTALAANVKLRTENVSLRAFSTDYRAEVAKLRAELDELMSAIGQAAV